MNEFDHMARQYYVVCELYDRKVCSGPIGRDGILPLNHHELSHVNAHAGRVYTALVEQAKYMALDGAAQFKEARRRYCRSSLSVVDSQHPPHVFRDPSVGSARGVYHPNARWRF